MSLPSLGQALSTVCHACWLLLLLLPLLLGFVIHYVLSKSLEADN